MTVADMHRAGGNDDAPLPGRLILGRLSPALKNLLWDAVQRVKEADPMAPVTVVAPNRYASLSLRQDLGQAGFVNVRFIQLPVLAELLGGAALSAQGRRPLTSALQSIFLREALAKTTGALQPVSRHPKTQASVRASFQELRRLNEAELAELETLGGVSGEVVRLYRSYWESIGRQWFDQEDLTATAAQAVDAGQAPALADLGHIVFYLPHSVSHAESELMQALARQGRCTAILGTTGDPVADGPTMGLAGDLEPILGPALEPGDAPAPTLLPGDARLHVAPNTHEELRRVIREIVAESGGSGTAETPRQRLAVLYRMENPYGTLIRDELAMAGIPLAGPGRESLAETAVGRTLAGLLSLADRDFRRDEVMAWLTGCPVNPPADGRPGINPSQWDAVSRQAGVIGGVEQWRARLNGYAGKLEEDARRGLADGETSEGRAAAMRDNAAVARRLLEFVEDLADALAPPEPGSSWGTFCDWAARLLGHYLAPNLPAPEEAARERIERALEELRSADSARPRTDAEEFRQALADSLRAPVGRLGATGEGVFVSTFAAALGMSFDVIWLVGMVEGGAPPAVRPDPLLPSAGRPSRTERRIAQERYEYLSAIATAPRRTLSYPVAESASQRKAHPSRWFLEQASELAGRPVHSGDLPALADRPWLTVTESGAQALAGLDDPGLADTLDYQLHRLLRWRAAGQRLRSHPLAAQGDLWRANYLDAMRNAARLTEFDGNLSEVAAEARFVRDLGRNPISPTRLETWAGCPFRYFLGSVLRVGSLETPEDTATISALDRGSLIHTVLEKFIREVNDANELPPPGESWGEDATNRLMQLAEREFADAEARGVTGKRLLWNLVKQDIRDDLARFLVEDGKLRERNNTGTIRVEAGFGWGGDSPSVPDRETGLSFRGYIDRMDLSADGQSALVVDYKTGSLSPYRGLRDDPIDHGKRLQLGVYSLAAKRLAPQARRIRAAYWFTTEQRGFELVPPQLFNIDDPEVARRFREGVSTIVAGIRSGIFPAHPGVPREGGYANCRFCDFDSLCVARRGEAWERKKSDPRLATYLELADADGEVA